MATGVVAPYASQYPPEVAVDDLHVFLESVRPTQTVELGGAPGGRNLMQPEEIALLAQRVAVAAAAGYKFPRTLDPRVRQAADHMLDGRPFVIRAAGRAALITPQKIG